MVKRRRKRQEVLQETYGELYIEVSQLLRKADPIRLIIMGAPDDEYDPEVSTILPRLREAGSAADVQRIVHEEFTRWFSADIADPACALLSRASQIRFITTNVTPAYSHPSRMSLT